jgi:adenosylcobyric acid synthase
MTARALMLAGTGSDVGKSLLVAGLLRVFKRRGLSVRPFKPQNMSNNAAVTADGGEIGRAQALQARAAGVQPTVHMNPVLLKPQSDVGAQVVVQGRVLGTAKAREFQDWKPKLMTHVLDSFGRLCAESDLVLVEGAGSASEVNLRAGDIANLGFARAANVPVVLIGDIDRGGVIASLAGTKAVIAPEDAAHIAGFIVNKFRGDPTLFADGMKAIEQATGWPGLGLVQFFRDAGRLPAEDALALDGRKKGVTGGKPLIAVLAYPRISNFDDFDPLALEPGVELIFLRPGEPIPGTTSLVILPGSKATIADLAALRETGWHIDIEAHRRRGGHVLGICGGYQMLGTRIADPQGIEGPPSAVDGLGLLDVETVMTADKTLTAVTGTDVATGTSFSGYEMHVGRTTGVDAKHRSAMTPNPMFRFSDGTFDGASSPDGRVSGAYIHGLFSDDAQRARWLERLSAAPSQLDYEADVEATLDALAEHLEAHIDCDRLLALARVPDLRRSKA